MRTLRLMSVGLMAVVFSALVTGNALSARADEEATIKANLAKLSPEDRSAAEAQKFCAIQTGNRLGSMGVPVKVMVENQPVFLCCGGCKQKALANPQATLASVKKLKEANAPKPKT